MIEAEKVIAFQVYLREELYKCWWRFEARAG